MATLKEYLKKYENPKDDETKKKKKKKKNSKPTINSKGVLVVDEDPVWGKPVKLEEEDDDDEDAADDKPQINEDIEVKRMKRLELLRARKPYHGISEDGSGWVSVSDTVSISNSENQTVDTSPPRRGRYDTPSPEPGAANASSNAGGDHSPQREKRKRYDSLSPEPVKSRSDGTNRDSLSPPRRVKVEPTDLSPPRRNSRGSVAVDLSPPRRGSRFSGDISPPRKSKKVADARSGMFSAEEMKKEVDMNDLSPPRRRSRISADLSPPRRRTGDHSPPRRGNSTQRTGVPEDLSPPRRRSVVSENLPPPRKSKTVAEARAGLFSGQDIKREIDMKKKEELARYKELDPSVTGRGAEPVYRDKEGKRISKDEVLKLQKGEEKPKEKKLEWGKGLAQKREAEAKEQELELEKDKPFARTRDDPELDKMLKERVRWGDPMAHLVKKKHSDLILEDLGDDEKMKESGFMIPQDIPNHSWIKRRIDAPPNRYGIKPGRHWDGVDRSTGYEKDLFKRKNEKQATEREAYLWSVSDM